MLVKPARALFLVIVLLGIFAGVAAFFKLRKTPPLAPLSMIHTLAGAANSGGSQETRLTDPFGLTVTPDATIYVTDGDTGRLWRINPDGSAKVIAENLDTPSAIALAPDGSLVVAETGAHVVRRINPENGQSTILAGTSGRFGHADGLGTTALFNGPVGVAVASDGTVYVADTYNDRVRAIEANGNVKTLAGGGEPGFADADDGAASRFDTPCGIAIAPDGALIVADTGNHRLRRVGQDGSVRTIAGTGEPSTVDGVSLNASFAEPTGVTVDAVGKIYVTDARGSALRVVESNASQVTTLAGGKGTGFRDGAMETAILNRPANVALAPDGTILFTDAGNKLVRAIVGIGRERGSQASPEMVTNLAPTSAQLRVAAAPRWPYTPPERKREIAATFGEIRGELTADDKEAWFHNGLDIPGGYGETVHAVRSERVLRPLPVDDVSTTRERIRFPTLGYIHLRIGRDASDRIFDEAKFVARRDEKGKINGIRVRRGTRFAAGDAIGTLNNQNHVHLIAGNVGRELNALAALELPDVKDTVAPVIEKNGISFFDASWREIRGSDKNERIEVTGNVRLVVRGYDQMNGNAARRKLGLYRLGYQVLASNGKPAPGFAEPLMTISFESLPSDESAAQTAYAAGSRSGATGETIFAYIVTNIVRDRDARESFWEASKLPAGDYVVRVFIEDFFGNRTTNDTPVRILRL